MEPVRAGRLSLAAQEHLSMLGGLFARLGAERSGRAAETFYQPYAVHGANYLYNLMFCDNLTLFQSKAGALGEVLSPGIDRDALDRIGNSLDAEARVRVLAFNRLRSMRISVPRRRLLGTIVEFHNENGLDVLAAYVDGRTRYINFTGKIAIGEAPAPQHIAEKTDELMRVSQITINQLPPCPRPRQPPPRRGLTRLTFLASDGYYLGEAPVERLLQDRFAKPVMLTAGALLRLVVDTALTEGKDIETIRRAG